MTEFAIHPATPDRWPDLERLFLASPSNELGEPAACWCMEWRMPRDEWEAGKGAGNRRAMETVVASGATPGLIAYADGEPAAWCAVAPRAELPGLRAVGEYRNFEASGYWTVSCFYIAEPFRGQGLMQTLLEAAVAFARERGARVIEGYPVAEPTEEMRQGFYMGRVEVFAKLGFVEAARGGAGRAIMRKRLDEA